MPLWPVEDGRDCVVPGAGRRVAVPLIGNRPALGLPPFFDAMDPSDVDVFVYDWAPIAFPGDRIIAATIVCVPAQLTISTPIIFGLLVQAFIGPSTNATKTFDITCAVTFVSGRVLDWGCEISVQSL